MPRRVSVCKACRAKMIWCRTGAGKNMPVNYESSPEGNVEIPPTSSPLWEDPRGVTAIVLAGQTLLERRSVVALHKAHHATCPHAAEFRKPRT